MFEKSKWIWTRENQKNNQFVRFKIDFENIKNSESAMFNIAAETKYYLYLNNELVVFDGGLHRESKAGCGYYDEVLLKLKNGKNTIIIDVWYWGNGGRNNTAFPVAGLIFESDELGIYSSGMTECGILSAYFETEGEQPSYLYGGYNIGFDANKDNVLYSGAKEICECGENAFGIPLKRPIPLIKFENIKEAEFEEKDDGILEVALPYAMQFSPYLKVRAKGGEMIDIRSDRYYVNGGPGDNEHIYRGHRYEYICREGEQEYKAYNYIFGEKIIYKIPRGVEVISLGYRENGYDCEIVNLKETDDELLNRLLKKCARTLKACMRENFMDCPDRERGQWIGDVSVQAPQVFICLSESAVLLLKKAIMDFIGLRKGDALVGNVPGDNFSELPSQSLNAVSEFGMIACYYKSTSDKDMLNFVFEPIIRYLKLWEMGDDGFVISRKGNWRWFDHGFNVDAKVMENCFYYSALKFALFMSDELCDFRFREFLTSRKMSMENNFEQVFYDGYAYKSGDFYDDRANALAVISGLADISHAKQIRKILVSVFNSTPYMEGYVIEALCILGYKDDAYKRMMMRYYPLIINDNSTVWEDFFTLGTRNHAWSGAPLTLVDKYFRNYK